LLDGVDVVRGPNAAQFFALLRSWADKSATHAPWNSLRLLISPLLPMMLGLRAPLTAELLVPSKVLTYAVYAGLFALFAYGAVRTRHQNVSLLYTVAAVFPFVWAIARRVSFLTATPRFLVALTPVLVLLLAQVGTRYWRAVAALSVAVLVTAVTVQRMDADVRAVHPRGVPLPPRDLGSLVSTLDGLHLGHLYADYWIAYRLDFDTRERIVATPIELVNHPAKLTIRDGQAVPLPGGPPVRYPPYATEVERAPHGFVFFRQGIGSNPVAPQLDKLGYRRLVTGPFVVYSKEGS